MREEFAAWYLAEVTQSYGEGVRDQAKKNLDWAREDGSFADPMLRLACLAWQASRAAVVVELPAIIDKEWANTHAERSAMREAITWCKKRIEAAGVRVQP
ncbi:hypothetical protein SAMN03159390_00585 [Pseudomonas sp. NFACC49-2]|nr:hypothetical protein SAMN03159390_00585 [Pseudomonas sp. NFACC49-2]